jgi:hypothetical protein
MIRVQFGSPSNGWLSVKLNTPDFELQFDASDVPANPLEELCSALTQVLQGAEAEVHWHLEPAWYYFCFKPNGEVITLVISEKLDAGHAASDRYRVIGGIELLLMPFYRALKRMPMTERNADWPALPSGRIEKLTGLIKAWKNGL